MPECCSARYPQLDVSLILAYFPFKKTLLLELDEEVADEAKRYAQRNHTSLDALVVDYLRTLVTDSPPITAARLRLMEIIQQSTASSHGIKTPREELYDRSR